ncbi:hypothetical protein HDU98_001661 [Podochytrium sp. JEL0797]|nr:hypothetical protein HDU98_001661 [Podochytrium sp. JEL0797]
MPEIDRLSAPPGHVYYFAYGSNMAQSTMIRRNFKPQETRTCVLPGYVLSMGMRGIPYFEPAFATIFKRSEAPHLCVSTDPDVHGAVHLISEAEFRRISFTEAGFGHKGLGYQQIKEDVTLLDANGKAVGTCEAVALANSVSSISEGYWPSKRYLELCVSGAMQQNVPAAYIAWLASHPSYDPAKAPLAKRISKWMFGGIVLVPTFGPILVVFAGCLKGGVQVPWVFAKLETLCVLAAQTVHRVCFQRLFGSGINHLDLENK